MALFYNPTAIKAGSLLQRRPMSEAQKQEALSRALQEQMANDPRSGQIQDWRDRSMTPFGVGAGLTGVAAQMASALVAKGQEKKLAGDYQDRQAKQNEAYARILGQSPYSTPGIGGDQPSPMDGLPPQQREMVARVLQSGDQDMIEAVVGQVVKQQFEPGAKPKYGITTANGRRVSYREDDPTQTIDMGAADDKPPSEWDLYSRAMEQLPENKRVPFVEYQTQMRRAGASNTSVTNMMPGPKKADEAFASGPYVDWLSGGYANVQKNIQTLDEAIGELNAADPGDLSGPGVGLIPDAAKPFVAPQSLDVQQRIEQVVQGGMREVLGGQYTQNEADAYIKRMYNPKLSEAANVKRLQAFRNQLMRGAQAKQASSMYFQKNGTLEGYQGQMPSWDDFYSAIGEKRETEKKSRMKYNPETGDFE